MSLLSKVYETITAQSELVLDQQADDGSDRVVIKDSGGSDVAEIYHDGTNTVVNPLTGAVDANGNDITGVGALDTDALNTSGGYSWQDVSGSRSFGTWFSAPSDRDIWVSMNAIADSDSITIEIIPNVNTSQSQNRLGASRDNSVNTNGKIPLAFKVPAGQDYQIEAYQDVGSYSIDIWVELR